MIVKFLKLLLVLVLGAFGSMAHAAEVLPGPIHVTPYSIYDGDTFKARARIWIGQELSTSIRINGIDTPEIRGKCEQEKVLARKAKVRLHGLLVGRVELRNVRNGKYAGRVLADVYANGENVIDALIAEGHARRYDGGARESWCD